MKEIVFRGLVKEMDGIVVRIEVQKGLATFEAIIVYS